MKKTFTINLAGSIFHIDEDAYILLDNCLCSLREYFNSENGGNEIVGDIELRISELFTEYLETGMNIISIPQAEEVINRVGQPQEMDGHTEQEQVTPTPEEEYGKGKRRFFRDPSDKLVGGGSTFRDSCLFQLECHCHSPCIYLSYALRFVLGHPYHLPDSLVYHPRSKNNGREIIHERKKYHCREHWQKCDYGF